jgi:hypothetical protein
MGIRIRDIFNPESGIRDGRALSGIRDKHPISATLPEKVEKPVAFLFRPRYLPSYVMVPLGFIRQYLPHRFY